MNRRGDINPDAVVARAYLEEYHPLMAALFVCQPDDVVIHQANVLRSRER